MIENPEQDYSETDLTTTYGVRDLITKARKIIKKFRRSTINNDVLQKHVKEKFGHEKQLKIDSKTGYR